MLKRKWLGISARGVTITEFMIVIAILGMVAGFSRLGISLLRDILASRAMTDAEREAQVVMYLVSKDLRNCNRILNVSTGTLQMESFDLSHGMRTDVYPDLFSTINIATITYKFVGGQTPTYLNRIVEFKNIVSEDKRFLRGVLVPPVDNTTYMFNACGPADVPPCPYMAVLPQDYESIEMVFRLLPPFKKSPRIYTSTAMKRTRKLAL